MECDSRRFSSVWPLYTSVHHLGEHNGLHFSPFFPAASIYEVILKKRSNNTIMAASSDTSVLRSGSKHSECSGGWIGPKEIESWKQLQMIKFFHFPTQNSKRIFIQLPYPLLWIPSFLCTEEVCVPLSSEKLLRKGSEWFWSHGKQRVNLLRTRAEHFRRSTLYE